MKLLGDCRTFGPLVLTVAIASTIAACGRRAEREDEGSGASRVTLTGGTLPPTAYRDPPDESSAKEAPQTRGDVPKPQRKDAEIVAEIEAAIAKDPALSAGPTRVTVACSHGEVTLTGVVKDEAARAAVERIARNTAGVLRVRDYLDAADASTGPGSAGRRPRATMVAL